MCTVSPNVLVGINGQKARVNEPAAAGLGDTRSDGKANDEKDSGPTEDDNEEGCGTCQG